MFTFKRKAQASLEFIVLFVFITVLVSLLLYFIGFFVLEFSEQEAAVARDDLANRIISEFNIYEESHSGYFREFTIPYYVLDEYNVTFNVSDSSFTIGDINFEDNNLAYYFLPQDIIFSVRNVSNGPIGSYDLIVTLNKSYEEDFEFILIQ